MSEFDETEEMDVAEELPEKPDYSFELDEEGRTTRANGSLVLGSGERDLAAQIEAGGEFRRDSDDGGHLIGARFMGQGDPENLIAQDAKLNRGGYKSLENVWADNLEQGKSVDVDIQPVYQDVVTRPHAIMGNYTMTDAGGGEKTEYFSFTNENLESEEFELPDE